MIWVQLLQWLRLPSNWDLVVTLVVYHHLIHMHVYKSFVTWNNINCTVFTFISICTRVCRPFSRTWAVVMCPVLISVYLYNPSNTTKENILSCLRLHVSTSGSHHQVFLRA
jgi:hypothetical protein